MKDIIVYTGDIHGDMTRIFNYVNSRRCKGLVVPGTIVILGDVGANFYLDGRDWNFKRKLNKLGVDIFCIYGNHECRPQNISTYHEDMYRGGRIMIEDEYPNLKFAIDGEVYDLAGRLTIVVGGAYSVDKKYRLANQWEWFPDEQPSDDTKRLVESKLDKLDWKIDQVLTHTCPYRYRPVDEFDPSIDQSQVDSSTELWLEEIENKLTYDRWLCGHYHVDRHIDNLYLVMNNFIED